MKNEPKSTKDDSYIKIGIDLGTTNSEIAINVDNKITIVKNSNGSDYTPSVFGIDRSNNKRVGIYAYDRLYKSASEDEFKNNKAEIKRLMGTSEKVHFERLDADLSAEEISAEILKSLKSDVTSKYSDFSTVAAVITVPSYFSALQAEATKRAGELAGFKHVVLLQEPIAAAMAYGFDNNKNQNILVYDLGGGTFDVAVISSKDGVLTVLGHGGNNFLGGKDFDLMIVDDVIKPAIQKKYKFTDFERNNKKYRSVFAHLKAIAEAAKIELSQYETTNIQVEDIGKDDEGEEVFVSIQLERNHFEELIKPSIDKTIDLAKKTLHESGIQISSVSNIILVGGQTQTPLVQKSLNSVFGVKVDNSIDPLTIVARGATVFGISQRIPQDIMLEDHEAVESEKNITLHYKSMTGDDEQMVTGVIDDLKNNNEDYYIQIQSESGFYNGSKIKLKNGKFIDTIQIEQGKTNMYWIYLFDDKGNSLPIFPDSFSVTQGTTSSGSPIPHDVGVIYAKQGFGSNFQFTEVCEVYFEKNSVPPLCETKDFKTIKKLIKGKENFLPIKIYEGEYSNPSNNLIISTLKIDGTSLPYDLPEKTDLDITIKIDESRAVFIEAYIPSIEKTLPARADIHSQPIVISRLNEDLNSQKERLKKIKNNIKPDEYNKLENAVENIETNVKNADLDNDDARKTEHDLHDLTNSIDNVENDKKLPQLIDDFHESIQKAQAYIGDIKDTENTTQLTDQINTLESEGEKCIDKKDKEMLVHINEQINKVFIGALLQNPAVWVMWLNDIKSRKHELTNQTDGDYHIKKAEEAMQQQDNEELIRHVRALIELLPDDVKEEITKELSGITK